MSRRFVVQEHTVTPGDVHYDLMIEDGDVLVTWQLSDPPLGGARGQRSFDHRRRYLDYEGPVSHDRGAVRIWDAGELEDVSGAPRDPCYRARFAGGRLRGLHELLDGEGGAQLRALEAAP